jgi:epoxyqueuosine reductase QueG
MKYMLINKDDVIHYAKSLGAVKVGFAPVERWRERHDIHSDFFPDSIWPMTKSVIVMLIPSLLPIDETKISNLHRAQYHILNGILDDIAYRLAVYLNKQGCASIHVGRDGYGTQKILRETPVAAFSHVWAGYYAGLGSLGWNHMLLTEEYGPRHRLVSVFSAHAFEGDPIQEKSLCIKCRVCEKFCPTHSYKPQKDSSVMDTVSCAMQSFNTLYNHCSFCVKCCPVGADRVFFGGASTSEYKRAHSDYQNWRMGVGGGLQEGGEDCLKN